jgi:hypothetical protein
MVSPSSLAGKELGFQSRKAPRSVAGMPKAIAVRRFIAYIARNPHPP